MTGDGFQVALWLAVYVVGIGMIAAALVAEARSAGRRGWP